MAHQGGFENHRLRTLIWIVRQLRRQPLSLHEINLRWKANVDLSAGEEIERRTFCNYLHAIYDLFHIEIECRRSDGFRYHITRDERSSHNEHIMANFEMAVAVERARGLGDYLIAILYYVVLQIYTYSDNYIKKHTGNKSQRDCVCCSTLLDNKNIQTTQIYAEVIMPTRFETVNRFSDFFGKARAE